MAHYKNHVRKKKGFLLISCSYFYTVIVNASDSKRKKSKIYYECFGRQNLTFII